MTPNLGSNFGTEFGVKDSPNFSPNIGFQIRGLSNVPPRQMSSKRAPPCVVQPSLPRYGTVGLHTCVLCFACLVTPKCGPFPYVFFSVSDFNFAFSGEP